MSTMDHALINSQRLAEDQAREEILSNIADYERAKAFGLIDAEREYQDNKPEHSRDIDRQQSIASWLIFIRRHLDDAFGQVYQLDDKKAMDEVRKIAALAVAAMEYNETPRRVVT